MVSSHLAGLARKRAPAVVLQMEVTDRDVFMALSAERNGATLLTALKNYFAPDAEDVAYQDVARFPNFRKSAQTLGEFLVKLGLIRRKAEGRRQPGGNLPDAFAAAPCLQKANLSYREESVVLAVSQGSLVVTEIAQQMRRLLGPIGARARKGVLMPDNDCPATSRPEGMEGQE